MQWLAVMTQYLLTSVAPQKGSMSLGMASELSLVASFLLVLLTVGALLITQTHFFSVKC